MSQFSTQPSAFQGVALAPPNAILGVALVCSKDQTPDKIDLCIGAYRCEKGKPQVLPSVRLAEEEVQRRQYNHEYLSQDGLAEFNQLTRKLMFSEDHVALKEKRVFTCQSVSGTGSLRLCMEFIKVSFPEETVVYIPSVTWGNHSAMLESSGLKQREYSYLDAAGTGLDFTSMLRDIALAPVGSIILLHAIAHNPTGVDPTVDEWDQLREVMRERQLLPFFDNAYQGFVSGDPQKDAYAVRSFAANGMEMLVACSFSKNFGLYGERVGAVHAVVSEPALCENVASQLRAASRVLYSSCPTYGARIVATILSDDTLSQQWAVDCISMSSRLNTIRQSLHDRLVAKNVRGTWGHVVKQRGMFSYTGIPKHVVQQLKDDHHIYMLSNGRISLAGLNMGNIERFCEALKEVLGTN